MLTIEEKVLIEKLAFRSVRDSESYFNLKSEEEQKSAVRETIKEFTAQIEENDYNCLRSWIQEECSEFLNEFDKLVKKQ